MVDYKSLENNRGSLIRKVLGGIILVAPMDVEVPTTLFDGPNGEFTDLVELGYSNLGWLSKSEGITFPREVELADIESFGSQEPTRSDISSDVTSATFTCQETNKQVLEMFHNVDLDDVMPDPETGELSFDQPAQPETVYRRIIYIGKDGNDQNAKYIAKIMPRATVSEFTEQTWSNESELSYGLTVKATQDEDANFALRHIFGGPGFADLYENMGFTEATQEPTP